MPPRTSATIVCTCISGSVGQPSSLRRTNVFHHVQRGRLLDIVMCDFLLREMQIHCQTGHKLEALRVTQLSSSGGSSSFVVSVAFPLQRGNRSLSSIIPGVYLSPRIHLLQSITSDPMAEGMEALSWTDSSDGADSGYDEELISTASITSSIYQHEKENGRSYHCLSSWQIRYARR